MTISDPILEKVFLALRTNFIPDYPKEHITLRYYKEVRWSVLLLDAERMDKKLPATILHDGSINMWKAGPIQYRGLWVKSPDSLIFDHLAMPHITVPRHVLEKVKVSDIPSHEVIDTLWVGKSIDHKLHWIKVSGEEIQSERLDWSLA